MEETNTSDLVTIETKMVTPTMEMVVSEEMMEVIIVTRQT